ncbi:hypothetical protein F511_34622 [Dorcoceras hygrometricum]|uniref:Uncharacterized protein n=1 Tax=Dorcoceras hygrometricum TaxID=472368 RepID=A0A2Z7CCT7_9LAMI|nr:hypothetical protein F511_34622 [Dorcoceras hygrometricum]
MSSWTKSSVSLSKLHETRKPLNDKSGLGFSVGESNLEGTSTQSYLAYDKFKKMNFVKATVIHNAYESVKYDDQTSGQLNQKGKAGIGYIRPENSKPSWLKIRLEKDKAKASSKSSVSNQSRRGSKKMVTPSSKQAREFSVQICVLLQGVPDLALCEPKPFPTLKVLNVKTVGTYVAKQKGIDDGNEGDEPVMTTAEVVKKKPVTKKRTAPTTAEPVAKKKRKTVGRDAPVDKNLALVIVPQDVEPISTVPAVTPRAPRRRAPKRKLILPTGSDDKK